MTSAHHSSEILYWFVGDLGVHTTQTMSQKNGHEESGSGALSCKHQGPIAFKPLIKIRIAGKWFINDKISVTQS